jgi:hypothetical protein
MAKIEESGFWLVKFDEAAKNALRGCGGRVLNNSLTLLIKKDK